MRGRRSVVSRLGVLEASLTVRSRRHFWNLAALTDEELEALIPLSEKRDTAAAAGIPAVWTGEELALLERLGAKAGATPGWTPVSAVEAGRR